MQTILFTTDEDILESVSHYDQTFEVDIEDEDLGRDMVERPKTADKGDEVWPRLHLAGRAAKYMIADVELNNEN